MQWLEGTYPCHGTQSQRHARRPNWPKQKLHSKKTCPSARQSWILFSIESAAAQDRTIHQVPVFESNESWNVLTQRMNIFHNLFFWYVPREHTGGTHVSVIWPWTQTPWLEATKKKWIPINNPWQWTSTVDIVRDQWSGQLDVLAWNHRVALNRSVLGCQPCIEPTLGAFTPSIESACCFVKHSGNLKVIDWTNGVGYDVLALSFTSPFPRAHLNEWIIAP